MPHRSCVEQPDGSTEPTRPEDDSSVRDRQLWECAPGVWRSALNGPAWSPDGTEIAFATNQALYVADFETGRTRRLADIGDA